MDIPIRRDAAGSVISGLAHNVREAERKFGLSSECMLEHARRSPETVGREVSEWLTSYQVLADLRAQFGGIGSTTRDIE